MAAVEKLLKAFEAFKSHQLSQNTVNEDSAGASAKKKAPILGKSEKIAHCNTIADSICAPALRPEQDFPKFLGISLEAFFVCCNDADSDIRMTADECLNRSIKALLETHLGRIQVELYKEIKKNGPARSLRAALWRFADLCHLIRPQKCRPYMLNLVSCLIQIAHRPEELVQETLATSLPKICQVLGKFSADNELKVLLKAFLPNLRNPLPVYRRTAATCLTAVCQHSRKPHHFFAWLLGTLIDQLVPVNVDCHLPALLGVLTAFRHLIPHLGSPPTPDPVLRGNFGGSRHREPESTVGLDQLLQTYELTLFFLQHADHNVVTAALEALQQLLQTPPPLLLPVLLSSRCVHRTRIYAADRDAFPLFRGRSEMGSVPSLAGEDANLEDEMESGSFAAMSVVNEYSSFEQPDHPRVDNYASTAAADEMADAMSCASIEDTQDRSATYSNIRIGQCVDGGVAAVVGNTGTLGRSFLRKDGPRRGEIAMTEAAEAPGSPGGAAAGDPVTFRAGDLGSFTDDDQPLTYCARLLSSTFLLTGVRGGLMPERHVRVSVKALALGCLAGVFRLQPRAFCLPLFRNYDQDEPSRQYVQEVLHFSDHPDPQLRGSTAVLVGAFVASAMCEARGDLTSWLPTPTTSGIGITLDQLVELLLSLLTDEAAVTCRLAIVALKTCLNPILSSVHSLLGMRALHALLKLSRSTYWLVQVEMLELLPEISYTVVSYLEQMMQQEQRRPLRSQVPGLRLQNLVLETLLLEALGDDDHRVRNAAAAAFVRIVPRLYYPQDHSPQDPITSLAREKTVELLHSICADSSGHRTAAPTPLQQQLFGGCVGVGIGDSKFLSPFIESSLSRIVHLLVMKLGGSTSKQLTLGCLHTLCLLSEEYPILAYPKSWMSQSSDNVRTASSLQRSNSVRHGSVTSAPPTATAISGESSGLLPTVVSLLTTTSVSMDLGAHQHALQLVAKLFSGAALAQLQTTPSRGSPSPAAPGDSSAPSSTEKEPPWSYLRDRHLANIAQQVLVHLARLLNICTHLVEDQSPIPAPAKTGLPSLPNAPSLSPIKRKSKVGTESFTTSPGGVRGSPGKGWPTGQDDKSGKSGAGGVSSPSASAGTALGGLILTGGGQPVTTIGLGTFHHVPHYMKLYEVVRGAHSNYRVSLDPHNGEKFSQLLRTALLALGEVLEVATLDEVGGHSEELLRYLRAGVSLEPTATIMCVQQLLKALFGTNLASQWERPSMLEPSPADEEESCKPGRAARLVTPPVGPGLYHHCFLAPCAQLAQGLNLVAGGAGKSGVGSVSSVSDSRDAWGGWIKRKWERKLPSMGKLPGKTDKTNLASYIRLFESLVIKALKLYTVTSMVDLQCQVLHLLAQLVQLRVNYCLLDSEQIFIGFILKQFEFIEGGHVTNAERLIPRIFHFIVLLSYERYHSKPIIGVPKIIQLCDGLMASGQSPALCAIPSLLPIVEDLFMVRGVVYKADAGRELDTQREVMVSMLLRFVHYHQVLDIFVLVLQQNRRESEDHWKKLSRLVVDTLLPFLARQQVNLDDCDALATLHRLFEAVTPSVFRPVDVVLETLLAPPGNLGTLVGIQRWMSLVLALIRVLVSQSKEEVVLGRLGELPLTVNVFDDTVAHHRSRAADQSLVVTPAPSDAVQSPGEPPTPEEILARFLLQVIGLVSSEIGRRCVTPASATSDGGDCSFLCRQTAQLLLYVTHMFQSGLFRRVANVCMAMIKTEVAADSRYYDVARINAAFLDVSAVHPTLTLQWCNVLILLNFDSQPFWSRILRAPPSRPSPFGDRGTQPGEGGCRLSEMSASCNLELLHKGGLILFCDYICENLSDAEQMTFLIVNHIGELVQLYAEPPIHDLIANVHRNPAASGLFVQAIRARCEHVRRPSVVRRMLACLEAIHPEQSGALLALLVERFLVTPHLALARVCASMACRRVEMLLAEARDADVPRELPMALEDVDRLLETMHVQRIAKKHTRLVMLLCKLRRHWFAHAEETVFARLDFYDEDVTLKSVDKNGFVQFAVKQCSGDTRNQHHCPRLLVWLEYADLLKVLSAKDFKTSLLESCLQHGADTFLDQESEGGEQDSPLSPQPHTTGGLALHAAACNVLLCHLAELLSALPEPAQAYDPAGSPLSQRELKYAHRLHDLFSATASISSDSGGGCGDGFWEAMTWLASALVKFLGLAERHSTLADIPLDAVMHLARFAILVLEAVNWLINNRSPVSPLFLQAALDLVLLSFRNGNIAGVLNQRERHQWICTAVYSIHNIFVQIQESERSSSAAAAVVGGLSATSGVTSSADCDSQHVARICSKMAEMVMWLERGESECSHGDVAPRCVLTPLRDIVVCLARHPVVNSYVRTPPLAWTLGWTPDSTRNILAAPIPPVSLEYLQERDVFKQFIFRVNLLGWTSKQQFEETWMALLGVLSAVPSGESTGGSEEEVEHVHTACLAIKCITSLLLQSLLLPQPGNIGSSKYLWQPREKPIAYLHTRHGKRFAGIRNSIEDGRRGVAGSDCDRVWRHCPLPYVTSRQEFRTKTYHPSQISMEYLRSTVCYRESLNRGAVSSEEREKSLSYSGLDLHSCLHFLLDLYSQWLTRMTVSPIQFALLTETVRSIVMLSDIFTEKSQFEWMLDTLLDLSRTYSPEDEIMAQYLGIGICKAVALVGLTPEIGDSVRKVVEQSFRSTYLPTRILGLHGALYLLELGPGEATQPILPNLCEYLLQHLQNSHLPSSHSEDHTVAMWTTSFYLIENFRDVLPDVDFVNRIMQLALETLMSDYNSSLVHLSTTYGLERLVLTNVVSGKSMEPIVKLAGERFCQPNPVTSLTSLGLMLSCIYAGKDNDLLNPGSSVPTLAVDSEYLITAMEKITILFNRMKRGYPSEAETIAKVFPFLLTDYFPLNEIMNKIIGEFISSQQPHPHLVAAIVFQVFDWANKQGQWPLIREWVLLSLSNFTQQSPMSMAIWSLTCFFISASVNPWLCAIFPFVQQRMGKLSPLDVHLFCLAGMDFYNKLLTKSERDSFYKTIASVGHPGTPYAALLSQLT